LRRRTGEAVYTALKRRIVLNELRPGMVLTELGLARELNCSQASVREALLRLQADGLVLRGGHRGTSVTPLDREEAREILALRRRIEMRAAPRAARAVDGAALAAVEALLERMREAATAGDDWRLIEADTPFT
jgi:DNA-binding GntR family transcriptional regulator